MVFLGSLRKGAAFTCYIPVPKLFPENFPSKDGALFGCLSKSNFETNQSDNRRTGNAVSYPQVQKVHCHSAYWWRLTRKFVNAKLVGFCVIFPKVAAVTYRFVCLFFFFLFFQQKEEKKKFFKKAVENHVHLFRKAMSGEGTASKIVKATVVWRYFVSGQHCAGEGGRGKWGDDGMEWNILPGVEYSKVC